MHRSSGVQNILSAHSHTHSHSLLLVFLHNLMLLIDLIFLVFVKCEYLLVVSLLLHAGYFSLMVYIPIFISNYPPYGLYFLASIHIGVISVFGFVRVQAP